ncbi:helix-turn-helix domain-containing protein [Gordonia sp. HY442]|uniref:helix-turn-helix domain-containing protein n=1 Tax=Gordonia zhenghanii TaxID=2911516 RepID=UPI001F2C3242|nr:helix-turn-helix domain-containing protein [Gordonia zhenghanii]MCF8606791.1 helix-turn-helix domain-containing protein [Gordonia zhenghanii]
MTNNLNRPEEAAEKIRVSRATLFGLIKEGRIRSVKIGRRRFVTDAALNEYVERLEADAGAA